MRNRMNDQGFEGMKIIIILLYIRAYKRYLLEILMLYII